MPRYLVKLEDYYLEWSTIVDAPVTFGMKLDEFEKYYQEMYGIEGVRNLPYRLERVEMFGTSSITPTSAEEMIKGNRAGPNEEPLTVDEIFKAYCLQQPIKDGWQVPTSSPG